MGFFGWLNFKEGLPLWWSYQLNKNTKEAKEDIFDSIAKTRVNLLKGWAEDRFASLVSRAEEVVRTSDCEMNDFLQRSKNKSTYFTELFLLNADAKVIVQVMTNISDKCIMRRNIRYTIKRFRMSCRQSNRYYTDRL